MKTIKKSAYLLGLATLAAFSLSAAHPATAQVLQYGNQNQEGAGPYAVGFDPEAGATLIGLTAGQTSAGAQSSGHTEFFPDAPAGDFAGTDTIHVGSTFTTQAHDGYSYQVLTNPSHGVVGPDTFLLNYGSLLPAGNTIQTLTLGFEADDFQFSKYGNPFTATVNGVENLTIENALNSVTLTNPSSQFLTFGIDKSLLTSDNTLKLVIDEKGDGGDGYAVDFLTVGLTSSPVPEASTTISFGLLLTLGLGGMVLAARKRRTVSAASA